MPIDPSISLQAQGPNINTMASFLDLGNKKLALDRGRATYDADVAQRQAESQSAQARSTVDQANVQPLIQQQAANTATAQTNLNTTQLQNARAHLSNAAQQLQMLVEKPDLSQPDIEDSLKKTLQQSNAPLSAYAQAAQGLPPPGLSPEQYRNFANQKLLSVQSAMEQLNTKYPAPAMVNNGAATIPSAQGNQALTGVAPGAQQGAPIPNQLGPGSLEGIQNDAEGRPYIVQRSPQGVVLGTRPVPGANVGGAPGAGGNGPVVLPPNETAQTRDQLQAERSAANQAIQQAPQMHNINQEVARLADTDVQTGKFGALVNKVASATGYNLGKDDAADYNTLGKMLARSNAALAASMPGPHTNAGLEQTNAANGSPEYDKITLKKIANLNDALVTGTQLYQQGLENSVKQNGIFGKRQFDQAWSNAMDVDALRLKNAVDNGNQGEIQMLIKNAGGKGSPGAQKLFDKLSKIDSLAGQAPQ